MQLNHTLQTIPISEIKIDEDNPNVMTEKQMDALRKSMKRFGYLTPVIVDQDNLIADGEHRLTVYKEFGFTEIPCYKVELKDDTERRMLRQTLNKLHGTHDKLKDADELLHIFENNRLEDLADLLAVDRRNLQLILEKQKGIEFRKQEDLSDLKLDNDKEPITKKGDIYKLGLHRLMCGDCTVKEDVEKLLDGSKVDMLLTDPPYGVSYAAKNEFLNSIDEGNRMETDIENDNIEDYRIFFKSFLDKILFSDYNTMYIFMSGQELHQLRNALDDLKLNCGDYLVWVKNNHVLGRKDYNSKHEFVLYGWKNKHKFYGDFSTTVLEYDKPQVSDLHPTMKPIPLLIKLIEDGTQRGMLVYDAFGGSGSVLIACEQSERFCCTMEIDPHYCDVIVKRYETLTGEKAIKLNQLRTTTVPISEPVMTQPITKEVIE